MGAALRCELCDSEPRLRLPIRFAPLMAFHTVIDHGVPMAELEAPSRAYLDGDSNALARAR